MTRLDADPQSLNTDTTAAPVPAQQESMISAVVICFNQVETIERAVESILSQTQQDRLCDIIIVDDASYDGSQAVISELESRDPRIHAIYRTQNSGGASQPRNDGIERAAGQYVAFLDGDDVWLPRKLEKLVPEIERNPSAAIIYSWCIEQDRDTGRQRQVTSKVYEADRQDDQLPAFFVHGGPIFPSTAVIRRDVLLTIGGFDSSIKLNEENDLYLRCLRHGPAHCVQEFLVRRVTWPGSLGSAENALENLRWKETITERMLSLEPRLAKWVRQRDAQISFRRGIVHLDAGQKRDARRELLKSWRQNPAFLRPLAYFALTVAFSNTRNVLDRMRVAFGAVRHGLFK